MPPSQLSPSQLRRLGYALQARMKVLTLQQQISGLYRAMPRDLKQLLLSSPQRAAVLQASDPDWQVRHRTPAQIAAACAWRLTRQVCKSKAGHVGIGALQAFDPEAVNANGSPQHGRGVIAAATSMLARHYEQGPLHSSPSTPTSQMLT